MATKYTFVFTDTSKTGFDVQSYTANGIKTPSSVVLLDRASQASTTLKLYGKGLPAYGEGVLQNMVYMLENYANSTKPEFSIEGQLWYNNIGTTGSPALGAELFIRNATPGTGTPIITAWDAVILATGSSAMTGELLLAGTPTDPLHAIPLSLLTDHETEVGGVYFHLTADQNIFMDGLDVVGSPPALTSTDVNQLTGITGNVQTLLDNKLSLDGGIMTAGLSPPANITFSGGEPLGLPAVPSSNDAAASKQYVDDQNTAGTGELTAVDWQLAPAPGSPPDIINPDETSAVYTVTSPSTTTILQLDGISRPGHDHTALEIVVDNTFNPNYPLDVQGSIEYADQQIELLKLDGGDGGAGLTTIIIQRAFESLVSDIISPAPYQVLSHSADDNTLSITINGIKQYTHTRAKQYIEYATSTVTITNTELTGLDQTLDYDFNISVDGAPAVLVSIPSGTDTVSHGGLSFALGAIMNGTSPPLLGNVNFAIGDNNEVFTTSSSGATSSIAITDPLTANPYLFDVDASPDAIIGATFLSEIGITLSGSPFGSPLPNPDTIEIAGDVTASFPVGQAFAIRGSNDPTYGTFDGTYRVHIFGAIASGSPLTTVIPIATIEDSSTNQPLLPFYQPGVGSPVPVVPAPSPFGDVYITPIVGIDQVSASVGGIGGDYTETDSLGNDVLERTATEYVVFNYDILSGSKIETLKYT